MMDMIEMKFEMMSSTYRIEPLAIADTQPIADTTGIWNLFFDVNNPPPIPEKNPRSATNCNLHKPLTSDCSLYVNIAKWSIFNSIVVSILVFLFYVITYRYISSDPTFVITMGFTCNCLSFD